MRFTLMWMGRGGLNKNSASSLKEVDGIVGHLRSLGIRDILAVHGDDRPIQFEEWRQHVAPALELSI